MGYKSETILEKPRLLIANGSMTANTQEKFLSFKNPSNEDLSVKQSEIKVVKHPTRMTTKQTANAALFFPAIERKGISLMANDPFFCKTKFPKSKKIKRRIVAKMLASKICFFDNPFPILLIISPLMQVLRATYNGQYNAPAQALVPIKVLVEGIKISKQSTVRKKMLVTGISKRFAFSSPEIPFKVTQKVMTTRSIIPK